MNIQEPKVEFISIQPEIVTQASVECGEDVTYYCEDSYMKASWEGCGCSDGVNEDLVPCDDIV